MTTLLTLTTRSGVLLVNPDHVVLIDPKPVKFNEATCFRLFLSDHPEPFWVLDPWSVIKKHFEIIAFYPNEVKP